MSKLQLALCMKFIHYVSLLLCLFAMLCNHARFCNFYYVTLFIMYVFMCSLCHCVYHFYCVLFPLCSFYHYVYFALCFFFIMYDFYCVPLCAVLAHYAHAYLRRYRIRMRTKRVSAAHVGSNLSQGASCSGRSVSRRRKPLPARFGCWT